MTATSAACTLPRMDIKERIAGLLEKQGKNMTQLATHCGVSPQAVQQWIGKGRMPRPDRLVQIAEFFGIEASELFSPVNETPGGSDRQYDDLATIADFANLFRKVPAASRPRVYKAVRGLIIDLGGIVESDASGAANNKR